MEKYLNSAKSYVRNPLGIIGLLLISVYSISTVAFSLQTLTGWHLSALLIFNIAFPLIALITILSLIVWHHDKLYSPLDFSNPDGFENLIRIRLDKVGREIDEVAKNELKSMIEKIRLEAKNELAIIRCSLNFSEGKLDAAEAEIDSIVNEYPSAKNLLWKAFLCKQRNCIEQAVMHLKNALEMDDVTCNAIILYNLACYKCCNRPVIPTFKN